VIEGDEPYILEGDIVSRGIEYKILPQYPENIQKNVDVKIKFDVLPAGKTANIMVIKKADPELEKVSIEALYQWKFSPINRDVIQTGYITFIFQLK
jgi:protein TonB